MKIAIVALACLILGACGNDTGQSGVGTRHRSPAAAEAPSGAATPAPVPSATDIRAFDARCMAWAGKRDTDPAVLAADQRTCDCLGRTLKPSDFAMLLDFTEVDQNLPDYASRVGAVYQKYGMSEAAFGTSISRIRALGRTCLK
jgi:hypothetical protein